MDDKIFTPNKNTGMISGLSIISFVHWKLPMGPFGKRQRNILVYI